ncbi:MAG: hypothetical protein OEM26_08955 [Saprospiraceae bacterium]|nr:hypothetical protein [Saprospiraceae bacterium]
MQRLFLIVSIGACAQLLFCQPVKPGDLDILLGETWNGKLEYLDYSSNKKVAIPVGILVSKVNARKYLLRFNYNNEPHANSSEIIKIRKKGGYLNEEEIISWTMESDKLTIKTIADGEDNGRSADFYFTYEFSPDQFLIRKKVVYKGESNGFVRNEFRLSR